MFIFDLQVPTCYANLRPYRNVFILKTFQEYWEKFRSHDTYKKMNPFIKDIIYLSTNLNHTSRLMCALKQLQLNFNIWIINILNMLDMSEVSWKSLFTNFNLFISNLQISRSFFLIPCIEFQQMRFYLYIHTRDTSFYCHILLSVSNMYYNTLKNTFYQVVLFYWWLPVWSPHCPWQSSPWGHRGPRGHD